MGLHTFVHPVMVGIMSRQVERHEQGRLLGGMDIIKLTGAIIGAFGSTALFGALVEDTRKDKMPNVIMFVAAVLMFLAFLIASFIFSRDTDTMMTEKSQRSDKSTSNLGTLTAPLL